MGVYIYMGGSKPGAFNDFSAFRKRISFWGGKFVSDFFYGVLSRCKRSVVYSVEFFQQIHFLLFVAIFIVYRINFSCVVT